MNRKTSVAMYAISSLLLLACPYVLPTAYHYFDDIRHRTFQMTPWVIFVLAASLLLPSLLAAHVYFFHRLELPRKKLTELCLCALFALAAILVHFNVILIKRIWFDFVIMCCALFAFTLLTGLLFGKKTEPTASAKGG